MRTFVKLKYTDDELQRFTVLMFDYVVERCMVPGRVESLIAIVDAKDAGLTSIPRKKLKPLISAMKTCYRGRLYRFYGINVSFTLRVIWKMVKKFVEQSTAKQMEMYGSDYLEELTKIIDLDKLEKKYGGNYPNMTGNYYPPRLG